MFQDTVPLAEKDDTERAIEHLRQRSTEPRSCTSQRDACVQVRDPPLTPGSTRQQHDNFTHSK